MRHLILIVALGSIQQTSTQESGLQQAQTALEYVEAVRSRHNCSGGTDETLPVHFDHSKWYHYADVAVRMANLLTKVLIRNGNQFLVSQEEFLYDLVRNNVDSDSLIFGSAIAVEAFVFPSYEYVCPYAYRKDRVYSHDLSINYDYQDPNTEWYQVLKNKPWAEAFVSENRVKYRHNETHHRAEESLVQPRARQQDGHWTLPYYDCGGGDIWMVTYSAPIFGLANDTPIFRGIGTIDIDLTNIDINQCDPKPEGDAGEKAEKDAGRDVSLSVDVFRGTHQCLPSTECVPVTGMGFIPGAYRCVCRDGYYFPHAAARDKYFNGSVIEKTLAGADAKQIDLSAFECLPCAPGCDRCVDDSPCLYAPRLELRVILCLLAMLLAVAVAGASLLVHVHRPRRVIKSASPIFLHIMNAGAALMCTMMFIRFEEPDELGVMCAVLNWPRVIGFTLAYGALLIKTWRISAIFQVKSAKKLNLNDKVLVKRFLPIPAIGVAYLVAWTATSRPQTEWRVTSDGLKYKDCSVGWWDYGAFISEVCFLLWGAYLCFVVRKAPSLFNESKYITWAIYNNIILGTFIIIIRQLIIVDFGPDLLYIMDFMYVQVCVTAMMGLIYVPKLVSLRRVEPEGDTVTTRGVGESSLPTAYSWEGRGGCDSVEKLCQTDITGEIIVKPRTKHRLGVENDGPTVVST